MPEPLAAERSDLLRDPFPEVPALGLRERKKASAMRRLQQIAVEQFEEHGFANVTVEHIAEHAEVSPSSVYRYFGTKEGLVLRDEFDDLVFAVAPRLFAAYDPWTAIVRALELLHPLPFVVDDLTRRRMKIWHDTPAVRAAGFLVLDETATRLAPMMHEADRFGRSLKDYQIVSSSLLGALFAGLEQWYLEGATRNITDVVREAVELVRPAWAAEPPERAG